MNNRQWLLHSYPDGVPAADNFRMVETPAVQPTSGQVAVAPIFHSMDPLLRVRMNPNNGRLPPLRTGELMPGRAVGRIVQSELPDWPVGQAVSGELGWQDRAVVDVDALMRVDESLAPLSTALGVLGPSGIAAYAALMFLGEPEPGDTLVIPAAAGSVGSVALQIARLKGARVIAIGGGAQELAYLRDELAVDVALDWQSPDFNNALSDVLKVGVDVFLDLVGGDIHNAVVRHLNVGARVVLVGYVSAYNADGQPQSYGDVYSILFQRAVMRGFFAPDFKHRAGEIISELAGWLRDGQLSYREHVDEGFDRLPAAFTSLFDGYFPGKKLVRVGVK